MFTLEKETKAIKDTILRDTKNLFAYEEEEIYYKLVRVSNFWSNNCIKYRSNGYENKALSNEEYLPKVKPYLKYIKNNIRKCNIWQISLSQSNYSK